LRVTKPKGGFYFFVDFNDVKKNLKRKGVKTSNQLAEFLIGHPQHFAMVTGDACMLDPDNFGGRIAFVDYDGEKVLKKFKSRPPKKGEEGAFIRKNAPNIEKGIKALEELHL